MTITAPGVSATISVPDEPIVGLTLVPAELVPISHTVMERGSGSTSVEFSPVNDIMEELARQMVQQSLLPCDLVLTSSFLGAALSSLPEYFSKIRSRILVILEVLRRLGHA